MAEERSMLGKAWDFAKSALENTVYSEAAMRKTAQGAAELSHALFSQSNVYVPYGEGQKSLEVEGPQQSYLDELRDASQRGGQEQNRGLER